jgi:hypothetical protein
MNPVVIENPTLNSPFEMPRRHFKFNDDGITDEIEERRRPSSYVVPIPARRRRASNSHSIRNGRRTDMASALRERDQIDRWRRPVPGEWERKPVEDDRT